MNCWKWNNPNDSSLAMYIDFLDGNSNVYAATIVNSQYPFTRHLQPSTNNIAQTEMQIFTWTDTIDLTTLINQSLPLVIRLWISSDNSFDSRFNWKVGLMRTNQF